MKVLAHTRGFVCVLIVFVRSGLLLVIGGGGGARDFTARPLFATLFGTFSCPMADLG